MRGVSANCYLALIIFGCIVTQPDVKADSDQHINVKVMAQVRRPGSLEEARQLRPSFVQ